MKAHLLILMLSVLCFVGALLYVNDRVGWAQWCWVLASGLAGAAVVMILEGRDDDDDVR